MAHVFVTVAAEPGSGPCYLFTEMIGVTEMRSDFHDQVNAHLPKLRVQALASTRQHAAAEATGCAVGTAKSRVDGARRQLEARLPGEVDTPAATLSLIRVLLKERAAGLSNPSPSL